MRISIDEKARPFRRFVAMTAAALVLGSAGVAVIAAPASATVPTVTGAATCDTATGEWEIDWTIQGDTNPAYLTETATVVTQSRPTTATLVGQSVQGASTVTEHERVLTAGTYTQTVEVQWTNHAPGDLVSASGDVVITGTCVVPPPPLVSATHSEELLSCINGTRNWITLEGKTGGFWTAEYDFDGSGSIDASEKTSFADGDGYAGDQVAGYVNYRVYFTDSLTGTVTVDFNWAPVNPASLKCPQTINPCTVSTGTTYSSNLNPNGWDFSETRSYGSNSYLSNGLEVKTFGPAGIQEPNPAGGTRNADKAAGYYDIVDIWLRDIGEVLMDYLPVSGAAPGFQLGIDKENDGIADGYLVGEPNAPGYGADWWASVNDGRFNVGSGMGYADFGTLDEYLTQWPNAKITVIGYSLGSGVKGEGIIRSLTVGCHVYAFGYVAPPVVTTPVSPTKVDECGTANDTFTLPGANPGEKTSVVTEGTYTEAGDPANGDDAVITFVPNAGFTVGTAPNGEYVVVNGNAVWTFEYTDVKCPTPPPTVITPESPVMDDKCGTADDTFTLPGANPGEKTSVVTEGTYTAVGDPAKGEDVVITFVPNPGFAVEMKNGVDYDVVNGNAVWTFEYTDVKCPTNPPVKPPVVPEKPTGDLAYTGSIIGATTLGIVGILLLGGAGFLVWDQRRKNKQANAGLNS